MTSASTTSASARPELFFALVRPTGCPSNDVVAALRAELSRVGYQLQPAIKFSKLLHSLADYAHLAKDALAEEERIQQHMDAGDDLRKRTEDEGILALLAASVVAQSRPSQAMPIAWIFDSLKHKAEVRTLRQLYGEHLMVLSIYADQDDCTKSLTRLIARDRETFDGAATEARKLIDRDQEGADAHRYGQDFRGTFPLGDYFLSTSKDIRRQVGRMIDTLFGCPTRSPTRDEYAMSVAWSTALRSADLSRQVGAAIVDDDGEIIVTGCNEVPKPGGGIYWEDDPHDSRDFTLGYDPNAATSNEMLRDLLARMKKEGWLSTKASKRGLPRLAKQARLVLDKSRIANIIEFGRIVHAEMNAVLRAAARSISIKHTRMVCTTFPCHICARHLLGAGLSEVVYIEPYPKSMATDQYPQAIVVGEKEAPGQLRFRPFMGWSPTMYSRIFRFGAKKKDEFGHVTPWDPLHAEPRARAPAIHTALEADTQERTDYLLASVNIRRVQAAKSPTRSRSRRQPR
jgi:cytidine deaminase